MNLQTIDHFESKAVDLVAKIAPWCAPIPTAYTVGKATILHLEWPTAIGVIAAIVIESLGLVTCTTALELYQFNQTRRKTDPPAPFWLALALIFLYLLVAILLSVMLDLQPAWANIAPAIFPLFSVAGVTVIALRKDCQERVQQIANDKAERRIERQVKREGLHPPSQGLPTPSVSSKVSNIGQFDINVDKLQAGRKAKVDSRMDSLLDAFRTNPQLGISDAARILKVSRQTIYSYLGQLERARKISRNGHGIEVLK